MDTLTEEIIESIDNIDSCIMEAKMDVLCSLMDVYEKSLVILEYCDIDNISDFSVFQECFIMESGDKVSFKDTFVKWIKTIFGWIKLAISSILSVITEFPYKKIIFEINHLDEDIREIPIPKITSLMMDSMRELNESTEKLIQLIKSRNTDIEEYRKVVTDFNGINELSAKKNDWEVKYVTRKELIDILNDMKQMSTRKSIIKLMKECEFDQKEFEALIIGNDDYTKELTTVIKNKLKEVAVNWKIENTSFKLWREIMVKGVRMRKLVDDTRDVYRDTKDLFKKNKDVKQTNYVVTA
jgi:hypothetical protein